MKDLIRQPSDDIRIGTIQFRPALLQDHHPNFLLCRRLRKADLAVAADREVIIDQDLLQHSVVQYPSHVEPIRVDVQFGEERFYAVVLFGQRGQCAQQVAVSQRALEDVRGGDGSVGEDSVGQDVFDALPSEAVQQFVVQLAQRLRIGRKIRVGEGLIGASHLADELLVVGLLDLADEAGVCDVQQVQLRLDDIGGQVVDEAIEGKRSRRTGYLRARCLRRGEGREGGQTWKQASAGIWPFDFSEVFADGSEEGNLLEGLISVAVFTALT